VEKPKDAYTRTYKLRTTGQRDRTFEVSVPRDVILRQAKRAELTPGEFLEQYRAVAHFDDFEGVYYRFEKYMGDSDESKV